MVVLVLFCRRVCCCLFVFCSLFFLSFSRGVLVLFWLIDYFMVATRPVSSRYRSKGRLRHITICSILSPLSLFKSLHFRLSTSLRFSISSVLALIHTYIQFCPNLASFTLIHTPHTLSIYPASSSSRPSFLLSLPSLLLPHFLVSPSACFCVLPPLLLPLSFYPCLFPHFHFSFDLCITAFFCLCYTSFPFSVSPLFLLSFLSHSLSCSSHSSSVVMSV